MAYCSSNHISKMNKNTILHLGFVVVILLLCVNGCQDASKYKDALTKIMTLEDQKSKLVKQIDEQGREIASIEAITFEQNGVIEKQLKEIEALKELKNKIIFKNRTIYDTLQIALLDTIILSNGDSIKRQKFRFKDKWLLVDGYVTDTNVMFDSLGVKNAFTIEQGREKIGFLKYQTSVFIRNENPHTTTDELQSIVITEKKKWYEKDAWKIGLGVIGGYFIGKR